MTMKAIIGVLLCCLVIVSAEGTSKPYYDELGEIFIKTEYHNFKDAVNNDLSLKRFYINLLDFVESIQDNNGILKKKIEEILA